MDSSKYYFDYGRQAWVNKESPDELIVQSIPPVFFPTSRTTSRKPLEIINPESGETLEIKKIDKKEIKEEKQENTEVPKKFPPFPTIPPQFYGMPYPLPFPAGPPGYPFPPPHAYYPHPQQTQAPPPLGQPPKQNNMLFVVDKPKESEPISKPKENPPTQEENQSDSSQEEEEKEEETRKGRGRGNSRNQRNNRNENQRDKGRNHNDNRRNQDRNGNRGRGNRNDNRGRGGRKEEGRGRGRINNNNKDFNGYHNNSGNNSNYKKRFDDRNGENRNQGNENHNENNKNEERGRGRGDHHNERGEGGRGRGDNRGRGGRVQKPRPLMLPEYYKNGKYTASIDGKFWTLSQWPTGERDETHGCQFGRHKLNVSEDGSVKIVLFGGINDYKISLHYAGEDDPLGNKDPAGWEVARCGPSMADLALTKEAQDLGWTLLEKTRTHPTIYPPGVEPPEEDLNVE